MPSPLGHAIAGLAAGWMVAGAPRALRSPELKEVALFAGLGMLPDVDLLFGMHSGPTHGIGSAVLVGVVALAAARRAGARSAPLALACFAAYLSHTLLDWLGTDASPPIGIMALWPVSRAYYESDYHLFMAISRRYYQGWTFVAQNLRAAALEVGILGPVLVIVYVFRRRMAPAALLVTVALLVLAPAVGARQQAVSQPPRVLRPPNAGAFDAVLARYRAGAIDASIDDLAKLLAGADAGRQQVVGWVSKARESGRREDLEAALLLFSEGATVIWRADDPYPDRRMQPYLDVLLRTHRELRDMDRRTPFLRAWYLMWESFWQAIVYRTPSSELDFLDEALADFPNDARILLAAGSRHELTWWASQSNARRNLSPQSLNLTRLLTTARDLLRRSLSADSNETEARLRLIHVLLELDDLGAVPRLVESHDWTREQPAFRYLAALFDGDLHERKGDRAAAAAAYERASRLVGRPQSALVARAYVAHADSQRLDGARAVERAIGNTSAEVDPWWLFIRGQTWRFDAYLKAARDLVIR